MCWRRAPSTPPPRPPMCPTGGGAPVPPSKSRGPCRITSPLLYWFFVSVFIYHLFYFWYMIYLLSSYITSFVYHLFIYLLFISLLFPLSRYLLFIYLILLIHLFSIPFIKWFVYLSTFISQRVPGVDVCHVSTCARCQHVTGVGVCQVSTCGRCRHVPGSLVDVCQLWLCFRSREIPLALRLAYLASMAVPYATKIKVNKNPQSNYYCYKFHSAPIKTWKPWRKLKHQTLKPETLYPKLYSWSGCNRASVGQSSEGKDPHFLIIIIVIMPCPLKHLNHIENENNRCCKFMAAGDRFPPTAQRGD
jgi:hypothetical protein